MRTLGQPGHPRHHDGRAARHHEVVVTAGRELARREGVAVPIADGAAEERDHLVRPRRHVVPAGQPRRPRAGPPAGAGAEVLRAKLVQPALPHAELGAGVRAGKLPRAKMPQNIPDDLWS